MQEIIETYITYCQMFDINIAELDKTLPIMHWLRKMHKILIGARFVVASKNYSTKLVSDITDEVFKIISKSFPNKSFVYSDSKNFSVEQNVVTLLRNVKKKS